MELQSDDSFRKKRRTTTGKSPAVRWLKEWVPQDVISTGGKCSLLKWVTEDMLKPQRDKSEDTEKGESDPVTDSELLFLCSYEGCGKTFIEVGALRKHVQIHGERQYVCHFDGCGKNFLDSSKLKRHFLIHTGERDFVCPYQGCGKAFSLDFNLRAHMRTHSLENYHLCPYEECGKRFTHECKLNTHIKKYHEKSLATDIVKHHSPVERTPSAQKAPAGVHGSASSARPYACPYEGCGKDYIHVYKLNLHLKREHPGHNTEENGKHHKPGANPDVDEASEQDAFIGKVAVGKNKRSRPILVEKTTPSKVRNIQASSMAPSNTSTIKKQWPTEEMYEEAGEETEEREEAEDDEEETEDEGDSR